MFGRKRRTGDGRLFLYQNNIAECRENDIIVVTERYNSNRKADSYEYSSILPSFHR